jgi:hypothetical protein
MSHHREPLESCIHGSAAVTQTAHVVHVEGQRLLGVTPPLRSSGLAESPWCGACGRSLPGHHLQLLLCAACDISGCFAGCLLTLGGTYRGWSSWSCRAAC